LCMLKIINESRCPFCQNKNKCGAKLSSPCWCIGLTIPQTLLDLLADQYVGKACICQECITLFNESPAAFKLQFSIG
jgi:hypothetical protein